MCERVNLSDGTYTLTQEGDGTIDDEVNEFGVHQDLDQSPEEPKASDVVEEGKHQFHLTFLIKSSYSFSFQYLCFTLCI
jgi:hypothetical protein